MKPRLAGPASLPEVHASVHTAWPTAFRRMFAFAGPAYLVSVGYMDPGNWATDLEGGARFGYQLLWVLVVSNPMAILLQTLSARLGIVSGRDLAQACREAYPRAVSNSLWFLCEIAIAACDLAEVLGAAIGLNLLFHIPLTAGVLLTALDTILVLWLTRYGIRLVEAIILSLVLIVTGCFLVELWFAKPLFGDVASGLVPRLNDSSLYIAIGMLGATVMPHNLYLHSALVQTRRIGKTSAEKKDRLPLQLHRFVHRPERRFDRERRHPGDGRGRLFQERYDRHRDSAGSPTAGPAAGNGPRQRTIRGRAAGQRPVFHAHRNLRRADRHGRILELARAPLAAPPDHPLGRDHPRRDYCFHQRRSGHLPAAHPEPGDPEHAASLRHHSSDPFHQRPQPHGRVRQPHLGQYSGLELGRAHHRAEFPPGRRFHRSVGFRSAVASLVHRPDRAGRGGSARRG